MHFMGVVGYFKKKNVHSEKLTLSIQAVCKVGTGMGMQGCDLQKLKQHSHYKLAPFS